MTAPREKTTKKQAKLHVGLALLEFARECTKDIPLGEFEKLRKDGAKTAQRRRKDGADQHDHYLYGTPKRNDSRQKFKII
jgi:hypothetical protein